MKKRFFYLFPLFILLLFVVCSCKDDNNEPTPPEPSPEITIPSSENLNPVLSQEGGTVSIAFTTTADWTASLVNTRAESWITITPNFGTKGKNEITIVATTNETYDERNATIILKCGSASKNIVVTQKQKDALTITSSKYEVDGEGGNISVEVKANINFEVEVRVDWIKQQTEKTRTLITSNLNFTIEPNETGDKREGEIIIKSGELSETVKVYQGFEDFITLTKKDFTIPEEGGNVDIEIKSTLGYEVKMLPDVDWITEIQSRAVSTHTYHYTLSPNETYDSREAKIVFYDPKDENVADTVSIYQMYKGAILVARNEYQFGIDGGTLNLTVQTNLEFDIEVSDSWIQQVQPTRALTEYNLNFTIFENTEQKDREGAITIKDKNSEKKQVVIVKQSYIDVEREALIALYKATDGDNWTNNTNWCSDKPISEWYGVSVFERRVDRLSLSGNNLSGVIPEEIGNLKGLRELDFMLNNLSGEIPVSLLGNANLERLDLRCNQFLSIPESIGNLENLCFLGLASNNFTTIPKSIGNLKNLFFLDLGYNQITNPLPETIGELPLLEELHLEYNKLTKIDDALFNLQNLKTLNLCGNQIVGKIPEALSKLTNLEVLNLSWNKIESMFPLSIFELTKLRELDLAVNNISDVFPADITKLVNLEFLRLFGNNLSGEIPESIGDLSHLKYLDCGNNQLSGSIPATICNLKDLEKLHLGNWDQIDQYLLPNKNNFTGEIPTEINKLVKMKYLDISRNNIEGNLPEGLAELTNLTEIWLRDNRLQGQIPSKIIQSPLWNTWNPGQTILPQQKGYILYVGNHISTDFSKDKETFILQTHTKGNGINLVLMGDAFIDVDMESGGKYETMMKKAMESYFSIEPFNSLREYYDVIGIKAVSKNDAIGLETVFETTYAEGSGSTRIRGNNDKCLEYASTALQTTVLNNVQIIVILNDSKWGGTCYLYTNGCSISYSPYIYNSDEQFRININHEANGHGFGFLGDEYWYFDETIPQENIKSMQDDYDKYGWWANIDFTNDLSKLKWKHFVTDKRYEQENIGAWEGGMEYYSKGIYRPTEHSLMRGNIILQLNAPQREAIYKRAMKLTYGDSWTYDYEEFVKFDTQGRTDWIEAMDKANTRSVKSGSRAKHKHVPPVICNYPAVIK